MDIHKKTNPFREWSEGRKEETMNLFEKKMSEDMERQVMISYYKMRARRKIKLIQNKLRMLYERCL